MINNFPGEKFSFLIFTYSFFYVTTYDQMNNNSFVVLRKLPYLRKLTLTTSEIRILDMSAFSGLNFAYLDFSFNPLGEIGKSESSRQFHHHQNSSFEKVKLNGRDIKYIGCDFYSETAHGCNREIQHDSRINFVKDHKKKPSDIKKKRNLRLEIISFEILLFLQPTQILLVTK